MRNTMKKRIISGLLAFAMLVSFLPANLFPKVSALSFPDSTLEIKSDGTFTATFNVEGAIPWDSANSRYTIGDHYFVLVPDIRVEPYKTTVSEVIGGEISATTTQTLETFQTALQAETGIAWNDTVCFALDNGGVVDNGDSVTVTDKKVVIKGKLPNPDQIGNIYEGYVAKAGSTGTPYVAFLYSGQQPNGIGWDTADYNLAGLRVTPELSAVVYDQNDVKAWMVNGTDHGVGNGNNAEWVELDRREELSSAFVEVEIENLGVNDILITNVTVDDEKTDKLLDDRDKLQTPSDIISSVRGGIFIDDGDRYSPTSPFTLGGREKVIMRFDIENYGLITAGQTGTIVLNINWLDEAGEPQMTPVTYTLSTDKLFWTYPEAEDTAAGPGVITSSAPFGYKPTDGRGSTTLKWNGGTGTIETLPATITSGTLAGSTISYTRNGTVLTVGDTLNDGDIVTVQFTPVAGKGVGGPYTGRVNVVTSKLTARVDINFTVESLSAKTTVTVLKDDKAWNQSDHSYSIELDDGTSTYPGTWSGNVWTATGTLNDGSYEIILNGEKTGIVIPVVYGTDKNQDLKYYTVTVSTDPTAGGKAWIGTDDTDNGVTSVVVLSGEDVQINAKANGGYSFTGWTGTAKLSNATETISGVDSGPRTYTAHFGSSSVTIKVNLNGNGDTVGKQVRLMNGADQYGDILTTDGTNKGTFTLHAVPAGTYTVETRQSDGGTWVTASPDSSLTVDATGGSATVNYWTVSLGAGTNVSSKWTDTNASSNSGSAEPFTVLNGGSVYVHARPATGYDSPAAWSVTGTHAASDNANADDMHITNITSAITATPKYTKYSGTITVKLDGKDYTTFPGSVSVASATSTAKDGSNNHIWKYTGATGGPNAVTTSGDTNKDGTPNPPVTVSGSSRDAVVNYYSLTLGYTTDGAANGGGGSVNSTAAGNYLTGKSVEVTATANDGYRFVNWTYPDGKVASETESYDVSMSETRNLTANFVASDITYRGGSHSWTYNQAASPDKSVAGNTGVTGVTFTSYTTTSTMPDGLKLNSNGTITGTPTKAGTWTISVTAHASNGKTPSANWTLTVNPVRLKAPVLSPDTQQVSVAGASDGTIHMTVNPAYPADASVTYSLIRDNVATGKTPDASSDYTGLNKGTYYVQATLGSSNYVWEKPVSEAATKTNSNTVTITDPDVNNPSITQAQTYERNTAITSRAASVTFDFNVGDWSTLSGLKIDNKDVDLTKCTVTQPSGGGKTGSVTIPVAVLDALSLTNGTKAVVGTFSRTGINPLTATASGNLLTVQTTYTVSFDLNGGTAATGGAPSIANQAIKNTTVPTFAWGSIKNNAPTRSGYAFAGWSTDTTDTTAEWTSSSASYKPTADTNVNNSTYWNTTVKAVWVKNVVSVTVYKNGAACTDKTFVLVSGGKAYAPTDTTGNVHTYEALPAGNGYTIELGDTTTHTPTGHTLNVVAGSTQPTHNLYYYDVEVALPVITGSTTLVAGGKSWIEKNDNETTDNSNKATVELLVGGTKKATTMGATKTDVNYAFKQWTITKPTGAGTVTNTGVGTATGGGTFTIGNLTNATAGPITLTPEYEKNRYDATITVNVDDVAKNGLTVELWNAANTTKVDTGTTATIDSKNGVVVFHGLTKNTTYTIRVLDGTTSYPGTETLEVKTADVTKEVNAYSYIFVTNEPSTAAAASNAGNMPTPNVSHRNNATGTPARTNAVVVLSTWNQVSAGGKTPTLAGYTFGGWGVNDKNATTGLWNGSNRALTEQTTFYAIWTANGVTLANTTAYGALNVTGIRGFEAQKGSATGHDADTDFTYEVWNGTAWAATHTQDGITLNAGTGLAFTASSVPTKVGTVAAPVTTSVFRVRAISKLNGQKSAADNAGSTATTITVTIQPTYKVEYNKNSGGNDGSVSGTLPTDTNLYVVTDSGQDFSGAKGSGGETVVANTIPASSTRLTWAGGARTQQGWASSASGAVAGSFAVATVANASNQNKIPGSTLTLYAIWEGKDLTFRSQEMTADYNMTGDQWKASDYYTAPADGAPDVNLTHFYLPDFVGNGTGAANLTFAVTNIPSFMEYDATNKVLKLKDNTRIGNVAVYTIDVKVTDTGNGNKTTTGTVKLTVNKTTPIIMKSSTDKGLGITGGPVYYADDFAWDAMTYFEVRDPYEPTKVLSATANKEAHKSRWANTAQKITAGTDVEYPFTYTDTDTTNYNKATEKIKLTAVTRTIALQVTDTDDTNEHSDKGSWKSAFTNSRDVTYIGPNDNWTTVQVKIRIPETYTSDIEKLTWEYTKKKDTAADSTSDTFKDITFVKADGTTPRPESGTLTRDDEGEWILTFKVKQGADTSSHELKVTFTGEAGPADKSGSYKSTSATYTYKMGSEANKLTTPDPDLTRIEVNDGIDHPDGSNDDPTIDYTGETFKDDKGNAVNEKMGGLHLIFKPIPEDTGKNEKANPVKHYVVTLTGNKVGSTTPNTITITPDKVDEDGYFHYYWQADLNKGPVPNSDYTVEVQAFSNDPNAYEDSDVGDDATKAGYRELTLDMLTPTFADKVFTGRAQTGGSFTSPTGAGTPQVTYADKVDGTNKTANKLHVNMEETTTDPALTSNTLDHDYYIYVYVPQGTLYLALGTASAPVSYTGSVTTKGTAARSTRTFPHANWEVVQAATTLSLSTSTFNGQTDSPAKITFTPTVKYTIGSGTGNDGYGTGNTDSKGIVTGYYDFVYTLVTPAAGSKHTAGTTYTMDELYNFSADVSGTYGFKAEAKYKTGDERNLQLEADLSESETTFSYSTLDRTVTGIKLERFEAVNGTTGVKDVDTGANLSEDRGVVYGNSVEKVDGTRMGYYDATDRDTSKQMRMEGLRITVNWSAGEPDVYVVGERTLPAGAAWKSSNTGVANTPALNETYLTFKGAGVDKNFKTNLTFSYGGKTSNAVTFTMEKRPIDYKVISDDKKIWNNSAVVEGEINFDLPDNLAGDDVKITVYTRPDGSEEFQTTSAKYDPAKKYGPNENYNTNKDNYNTPKNADRNVGKDKEVRAITRYTAGNGNDVAGNDRAFYKRGNEVPGKADIKPALVTRVDVTLNNPSANTLNGENLLSNNRYKPNTDSRADEKNVGTGNWSLPWTTIKWEYWNEKAEGGPTWTALTDDHFSIDTVYRATVVIQADTNHYMSDSEIEKYTFNGKQDWRKNDKPENRPITDLDDWNNRPENVVTVEVDQSGPFHPDWDPEQVLYHNTTTFTYLFHTYETPSLQFSDEKGAYTEPKLGTDHTPNSYVHHTETVTEGASSMIYTITVNAAVKDIFGAQVLMTNKELLEAGATLEIKQGNGTNDLATPVRTDKTDPMYKVNNKDFEADKDLIIYELTIPDSVMATKGTYHLEFQAMGSTSLANMEAGKVDVAKSYYTFTLVVQEKQEPPVISGGGGPETPVVRYMVSDYGYTNDLTAEKLSRVGAKPSFVPKITAMAGLRFLGWSETDPSKITDGKLPTLVDPLTFTIKEDKIFYAVYEWIGHSHYVIGFPDGTFGPDNSITRGQVATIIARACLDGFVEGSNYGNPGNYTDVGEHWAASAIAYCSLRGVFAGYEDGTFRPDRYISRQELATVVARLAGVQANQGLTFSDSSDVANWALNGVYTNVANGWVNGYEDNTFRPLQNITRAETVKIFNGYLGRGVNAQGLEGLTEYVHSGVASNNSHDESTTQYMTWPDVTTAHWAYYEVIEAANDHDYHWLDATKAAPPEKWDAAYIEEIWRYYDNANDGGENVGKEDQVFTVTYIVPDGEPVSEVVKIYESPSVDGVPTLTWPEGFYLAGWSLLDPAVNEITEDDLLDPTAHWVEEDRTYYPVFEKIPEYVMPTVVVTYVIGDKGIADRALTEEVPMYESPTVAGLPEVTALEGCRFLGWSKKDPTVEVVTEDDLLDPTAAPVTENTTFYAVYDGETTVVLPQVTATYVIGEQGTTEGATTEQVVMGGYPAALPQVVPVEGFYLAGWSEQDPAALAEGESLALVDPATVQMDSDKTFYAVYVPLEAVELVTVSYVVVNPANGMAYEPVTEQVAKNTALAAGDLPTAVPDPGFTFAGWSMTDPAAGDISLVDPTAMTLTEDTTFYAVFQPEQPVQPVEPTEPVVYARTRYINGFEDGTFRPDEGISRAAVAKIIADLLHYDGSEMEGEVLFTDLENHWAKNVITFCIQKGALNGYEDGTFRPDNAVTRQEFAVILARLAGTQSNQGLAFADVEDIAPWALDGVYTAYASGWINGYEDGTFLPERVMTRAETVKIFNAYLGRSVNPEAIEAVGGYTAWNDVPATHWAYYEIVEAANDWEALAQQGQDTNEPAPEEGQEGEEATDVTAPTEGEEIPDTTEPAEGVEGEDPTQTPEEGQPGEGETPDQPEGSDQEETQPDNGEEGTQPEGEDPALPNEEENQDNADEGEDAPTDGDDQ